MPVRPFVVRCSEWWWSESEAQLTDHACSLAQFATAEETVSIVGSSESLGWQASAPGHARAVVRRPAGEASYSGLLPNPHFRGSSTFR
jgi:hypothetical protein